MPATILAVDDQSSFRFLLQRQLSNAGFSPLMAGSTEEAIAILEKQPVDLILSDLVMPETDGLAFLAQARERFSSIPFILLTAHGTVATAVEALKLGAFDYLEKNCTPDELQITIQRALTYHSLARENEQFKEHFQQQYSFQNIVTVSPQMGQVLESAASVANAPRTTVAIFGESGCGKEVLARAIHFAGGGMPASFVGVNCAAIPEALLESELFGHKRGSYTGAEYDREGKFGQAKGGTILLDEIGDMPLGLQAKLLRVLEERVFEAIGSDQPIAVQCRIVITTHHDLLRLVEEGLFRKDLYHRINVFPIVIPPLRERLADIPILVDYFMKLNRDDLGKSLPGVSEKGMDKLLAYPWPGNVRELRNCLERAAILVPAGELIRPDHLATVAGVPPQTQPQLQPTPGQFDYPLSFTSDEISFETITNRILDITLERCNGNKSKAASLLKVNRKWFYR